MPGKAALPRLESSPTMSLRRFFQFDAGKAEANRRAEEAPIEPLQRRIGSAIAAPTSSKPPVASRYE